jgi:hypothetical protein
MIGILFFATVILLIVSGLLTSARNYNDNHDSWDEISHRANLANGQSAGFPWMPPHPLPPGYPHWQPGMSIYDYERGIYEAETRRMDQGFRNFIKAAAFVTVMVGLAYVIGKREGKASERENTYLNASRKVN